MNEPLSQRAASRDVAAVKASPKVTRATRARAGSRDASRAVPRTRSSARIPAAQSLALRPRRSRDASASPLARRAPVTPVGFVCPPCGRFIPTEVGGMVLRSRTGSPPRFCSPGCRQAAYRRRRAGVAEDVALQLRGGRDRSLGGSKGASAMSGAPQQAHLARPAIVYVRQSTSRPAGTKPESTDRQYALVERAVALGWPAIR